MATVYALLWPDTLWFCVCSLIMSLLKTTVSCVNELKWQGKHSFMRRFITRSQWVYCCFHCMLFLCIIMAPVSISQTEQTLMVLFSCCLPPGTHISCFFKHFRLVVMCICGIFPLLSLGITSLTCTTGCALEASHLIESILFFTTYIFQDVSPWPKDIRQKNILVSISKTLGGGESIVQCLWGD